MAASLASRIERSRAKLAKLEERLGYLMTQRADEEERLSDLLKERRPDRCQFGKPHIEAERANGSKYCVGCLKEVA